MNAVLLPDADDFALNPDAELLLEEERRALPGRLPDVNEATVALIETRSDLDVLNEREAARQQARAEREAQQRDAAEQPAAVAADHSARSAPMDLGADLNAARSQIALLETLAPQRTDLQQPASNADDAIDDEVAFFRSPKEAVAKAVESHPVMTALKGAITETLQKKTKGQFLEEFKDAEQVMQDPVFRQWVAASPIRMELLRSAHEKYDLDAARHVFSAWNAVRGNGAAGAKAGSSKQPVYRRSDIRKLMIENPRKYEEMADAIAAAYESGRVR